MADGFTASIDPTQVVAGLDRLGGQLATHLARSMGVAGGQVLRDEAKLLAPLGTEEGGSIYPGALRNAIYLAFREGPSTGGKVVYSVSWNAKKAPHGHLIEFGHWQYNKVVKIEGGYGGGWFTLPVKRDAPKWIPAHPFLRPALDIAGGRARAAMIERGRERLPELLQATYQPSDEEFV